MRCKRKVRLMRMLALCVCVVCIAATCVSAHNISSLNTDSTTGWTKWTNRHMGNRYTGYTYGSNYAKNAYKEFVDAGISLWGVAISCKESTSNPKGTIIDCMDASDGTASVESEFNATGHITSWTMTIYDQYIPASPNITELARTFAHEVGHVYGLGHVSQTSQIMYGYASSTKSVTVYDMRGMLVMTHEHLHDESTNYNIVCDAYTHGRQCRTCYAYETINCYTNHWHEGGRHYFVNNCECGNSGTVSIVCPASGCPFS